jgi:hypothetical protein
MAAFKFRIGDLGRPARVSRAGVSENGLTAEIGRSDGREHAVSAPQQPWKVTAFA